MLATLRTREQTTIPDVTGDELAIALLKLQERELIPRVRLSYNDDQSTSGTIIDQSPGAGANVRVGKDVLLTISRGRAVFKIDSFIGKSIEEVNIAIQEIESNYEASIQLGGVVYVESTQPAGTVLEQAPLPNSEVGVFTQLDLVVSLGDSEQVGRRGVAPDVRNTHFESVIEIMLREEIQFSFAIDSEADADRAYRVVSQSPLPGSILTDEHLSLTIAAPVAVDLGFSFGVYEYAPPADLAVTPASPLLLRANLSDDQQRTLATYPYLPGLVSIPYLLPVGSVVELVGEQGVLNSHATE